MSLFSKAPHVVHHSEYDLHTIVDPHKRSGSGLSDIILGGQDGLVNVLGVILGVAAATNDPRLVLVAGLAATFAESVSMGAVAYTSTIADADYYDSEFERELRHIEHAPGLSVRKLRIYSERDFKGDLRAHCRYHYRQPRCLGGSDDVRRHRLTPIDQVCLEISSCGRFFSDNRF
jgi:hypothetical protein